MIDLCALLLILIIMAFSVNSDECAAPLPPPNQSTFTIGVLANRDVETTYREYTKTFREYLTLVAGARFDPPLTFEIVPVPFGQPDPLDVFVSRTVDFTFTNPALLSCIESETGISSILSQITRRNVGQTYDLTAFGGVIFTLAENDEVREIKDIKGKRIGLVSMSSLGGGQMQFRELVRAGIHHLQDPRQLIFMASLDRVVHGVLKGEIDVGFVRTEQLERIVNESTGELIDLSRFKIIGAMDNLVNEGKLFPFISSTPLYPEWHLASFEHVPDAVIQAVQSSLLAISDHATIAPYLLACFENGNCSDVDASCRSECFKSLNPTVFNRCDTTAEVALLAYDALRVGKYAGFRTSLPNMPLRGLLEETGFLVSNPRAKCVRTASISDAISCPDGYFKKSDSDITNGCSMEGMDCYGFECICSPCVKAFDVDFFPASDDERNLTVGVSRQRCSKFSVCGVVEQGEMIHFRALDNVKRQNMTFSVRLHDEKGQVDYPMLQVSVEDEFLHEWKFDATRRRVGVVIIEVYGNDRQISESPFRMEIVERKCKSSGNGSQRVADAVGNCVCDGSSMELGDTCIPLAMLLPSLFGSTLLVFVVVFWVSMKRRQREADSVWIVKEEDLVFPEPQRILGVGTFGFVLQAEYLGTKVAVKRVIPPKDAYRTKGQHGSRSFITEERGQWYRTHFNLSGIRSSHSVSDTSIKSEEIPPSKTDCDLLQSVWLRRSTRSKGTSNVMSRFSSQGTKRFSELKRNFMDEVRILSKVRHPNITTIMGAVVGPDSDPMLIMEYMELGSLYDLLHNQAIILDEDAMYPILRDVAKGLRFLHSANPQILHCDLKAQNILIDTNLRAKISDFGLSMKKGYFGIQVAGSPYFLSPELLRGESSNTTCSDVYAFGILMYEALSRKDPYEGEDFCQVLNDVANDSIKKRPPVPETCSNDIAALMKACLLADPEHRPTSREIDVRLQAILDESTGAVCATNSLTAPKRQAETEALINQLFPKHVADALRNGRKVEAETHEEVTIFFSDIVGYTSIASSLSPTKVSNMLDRLFTKLDKLCDIHKMFKVETIGDAFMSAANLAEKQSDHVFVAARFALDAITAASDTLIDLEDPSRGHIQLHAGFHTGPVVTNVVGSRTPRYSVIGDTVNVAARMESTSLPDHIQCSELCAIALKDNTEFTLERRGKIEVKGKGEMVTYWVWPGPGKSTALSALTIDNSIATRESIINWTTDVLKGLLQNILIVREASMVSRPSSTKVPAASLTVSVDAMKHAALTGFVLPEFNVAAALRKQNFRHASLSEQVTKELKHFVVAVAHMYHDLPFHNFEHASFVTMNVTKIISALTISEQKFNSRSEGERMMHEASFGLSSDPIAQFAIVFASLVHNVAHPGVADECSSHGKPGLTAVYGKHSASQLNAIDLSFKLLMDPQYEALRGAIYQTVDELTRFRNVVICCVFATDKSNEEMVGFRQERWEQAFADGATKGSSQEVRNLRVTALTEHIMQASGVFHAFQQWAIYRKWNERYYREWKIAHNERLILSDPTETMYDAEVKCFERVVFPLAKRIQDTGVLGNTWNLFMGNAVDNFKIWLKSGHELTTEMTSQSLAGTIST